MYYQLKIYDRRFKKTQENSWERIFIPKLRGWGRVWSAILLKPIFGNHWFKNWAILTQKLKAQYLDPIIRFSHVPRLSLIDNNNSNPHTRPRNKRTVRKMAQTLPNTFFQIKPSAPILPTRKVLYFSSPEITPIFKLINSIWLLFRWRTVQQRAVVTGPGWWRVERRTYTLNSTRMQRCTVTVSS